MRFVVGLGGSGELRFGSGSDKTGNGASGACAAQDGK
jgi:hypothetical protein